MNPDRSPVAGASPGQPAPAVQPGQPGSEAAIEATDLVKTYPGDVRALDGISLTVEAGTIFGLLGPNGAGKSTTVKILTTLSRADSGRATMMGVDVAPPARPVRRMIGVVGQHGAVDLGGDGAREPPPPGPPVRDVRGARSGSGSTSCSSASA